MAIQQAAPKASFDGPVLSVEQSAAKGILDRLLAAEKIAPAGSHEHEKYLATALFCEWPSIKYMLIEKSGRRRY